MDEIEAAFPLPGPGDGTVASQPHDAASPTSDHRPYPYVGPGVINAVDAGEETEDQGIALAEAIRAKRDPRTRYVIHEGRIFSSYPVGSVPAWTWRPYTGTTNPHENHAHISVLRASQSDPSTWNLGLGAPPIIVEDMLPLEPTSAKEDIRSLQDRLNRVYSAGLVEDGIWGTATEAAIAAHLAAYTGDPDAQQGKRVVANQWNGMLEDWIRKLAPGGTQDDVARQAAAAAQATANAAKSSADRANTTLNKIRSE